MLAILFGQSAAAGPPNAAADRREAAQPLLTETRRESGDVPPSTWFYFAALVNAYPKIGSEKPIDRFFNPAMRALAPGYDDVRTIGGLRDDHLLWAPHAGVGKVLSDKWALFFNAGFIRGKVRTKADDASRLLLPLHTDFEIQRGALYGTIGLDYYPFGMPERRGYRGVRERLRAARPWLGPRVTLTYATYDAKVKVGFKPLPNLINLDLHDAWLLPSLSPTAGVDIPLDRLSLLSLSASYNVFWEQERDFEGAAYTISWKRFFR